MFEKKKVHQLSHFFNVPDVTIWRRAKKLGLEFKIGGANAKITLEEILEGKHPQYQSNKLKNRLINEGLKENKCEEINLLTFFSKLENTLFWGQPIFV